MIHYLYVYKKHWGQIPKDTEGRSFDIHHLDGNRANNNPYNLVALPIKYHLLVHEAQHDWASCALIAQRMNRPFDEISQYNRQSQLKRIEQGTHHFQNSNLQQQLAHRSHMVDRKTYWTTKNNPANKKWTCGRCGTVGKNIANYNRWHGENCDRIR